MKLNPDCVRDILLCVESCGFGERLTLPRLQEKLTDHTEEDLWYTCIKLEEGGYLDLETTPMAGMPMSYIQRINDLTYAGHEFINEVRENRNWDKVKDIAKKAGVFTLKALAEIAREVAAAAVRSAL